MDGDGIGGSEGERETDGPVLLLGLGWRRQKKKQEERYAEVSSTYSSKEVPC